MLRCAEIFTMISNTKERLPKFASAILPAGARDDAYRGSHPDLRFAATNPNNQKWYYLYKELSIPKSVKDLLITRQKTRAW